MNKVKLEIIEILDFYINRDFESFELSLKRFFTLTNLLEITFNEREFPELVERMEIVFISKIDQNKNGLALIMFLEALDVYYFCNINEKFKWGDFSGSDFFEYLYNDDIIKLKKSSVIAGDDLIINLCVLEFLSIRNDIENFGIRIFFNYDVFKLPDFLRSTINKSHSIFFLEEYNSSNTFFKAACVLHLLTERERWEIHTRKVNYLIINHPYYSDSPSIALEYLTELSLEFDRNPKLYFLKAICQYHIRFLDLCELNVKQFISRCDSSLGYYLLITLFSEKKEFEISYEYAKIGYFRFFSSIFLHFIFKFKYEMQEYYSAYLISQTIFEEEGLKISAPNHSPSPESMLIDIYIKIIDDFFLISDLGGALDYIKILSGLIHKNRFLTDNNKLDEFISKILELKYPDYKQYFISDDNQLVFPFQFFFGEKIDLKYEDLKWFFDIIPFGKYKNRDLLDIYNMDSGYFLWCILNIRNFLVHPSFLLSPKIISDSRFFKMLIVYHYKRKSYELKLSNEEPEVNTENETYSYEDWLRSEFGDDAGVAFWNLD